MPFLVTDMHITHCTLFFLHPLVNYKVFGVGCLLPLQWLSNASI